MFEFGEKNKICFYNSCNYSLRLNDFSSPRVCFVFAVHCIYGAPPENKLPAPSNSRMYELKRYIKYHIRCVLILPLNHLN
jgi:hypothetical protein